MNNNLSAAEHNIWLNSRLCATYQERFVRVFVRCEELFSHHLKLEFYNGAGTKRTWYILFYKVGTHYFLFLLAEACLQSCWPISWATSLGYSCAQYLSNETLNWFPGLFSEHSIERTGVSRSVDGLKELKQNIIKELLESSFAYAWFNSHWSKSFEIQELEQNVFLALFLCTVVLHYIGPQHHGDPFR